MATQGVVRLPGGQQGTELLPEGLDDVWWQGGHGVCSFCSGSLEDSPDDGVSASAFRVGVLPAYWRKLLERFWLPLLLGDLRMYCCQVALGVDSHGGGSTWGEG